MQHALTTQRERTLGEQIPVGINSKTLQASGKRLTFQVVEAGDFKDIPPEFGRTEAVQRHFGIKKGTLYNLHKQRKVRGRVLRVTGELKGIRLWDMNSIREFIIKNSSEDFDSNGSSEKGEPLNLRPDSETVIVT